MKYLSEIMENRQSELWEKKKVFFAFNEEQFKEGMKKYYLTSNDKIVNMGAGMFCPKKNAKEVNEQLDKIYKESIVDDMKQGKDNVILRELYNHECFWSGDITDCVEKLSDYPITKEEIIEVFNKNYKKESLKF
jgi:hypothetical protein|tara:strand:- start:500 stop:901 length:402 start_codon:yes stop_codon:yes gene_type:complete